MFLRLLVILLVVVMLAEFLGSLQIRKLFNQMYGNGTADLPMDPDEQFVSDLSISYFNHVVLNTDTPLWLRKTRLALYSAWYFVTFATGADVFAANIYFQLHDSITELLAFYGSVVSLYLLLLLLCLWLVEKVLYKTSVNAKKREKLWLSKNNFDANLRSLFISKARNVYSFTKKPECKTLCWSLPLYAFDWAWVIFVVMAMSMGSEYFVRSMAGIPVVLYGQLFLFANASLGGLIVQLYFLMRIAPWDGVKKSELSLPFCCLWRMVD